MKHELENLRFDLPDGAYLVCNAEVEVSLDDTGYPLYDDISQVYCEFYRSVAADGTPIDVSEAIKLYPALLHEILWAAQDSIEDLRA